MYSDRAYKMHSDRAYKMIFQWLQFLSIIFAVLLIISFFDIESMTKRLLSFKCLRQY